MEQSVLLLLQFPQTSLREIGTLKLLQHRNLVGLKEVVVGTERERYGAGVWACWLRGFPVSRSNLTIS